MNSLTITHYNFDPVTIICLDQIFSVVMNCFSPPTGSCFFLFSFFPMTWFINQPTTTAFIHFDQPTNHLLEPARESQCHLC